MRLEARGIRKSYGPVEVLRGVDIAGEPGDVGAVVGANGAGKSTLIKVLAGAAPMSHGELIVDDTPRHFTSPHDAQAAGIRTVYQELTLVPGLSVTENILIGNVPRRHGLVDWAEAHRRTRAILDDIGFDIPDVRASAGTLTVARQQMVEIAKALASEPRVLVLDEPSAVLAGRDLDALFALIARLQQRGVLVIYVSHRLAEIMDLATTIVVVRDGIVVSTTRPEETSEDELIALMAGRRLERVYPDRRATPGVALLAVKGLTRAGEFADIDLELREGEVVGLFGLVGAGRSELARCLFGDTRAETGAVEVSGAPVAFRTPREAIASGVALLTEDRKRSGLVGSLSVTDNMTLPSIRSSMRGPLVNLKQQRVRAQQMIEQFSIRPDTCAPMPVTKLSGGNQQKVIVAKWLLSRPRILILDEPTRGVDVATRVEIYNTVDSLARSGHGVLLISSDLTEAIGATDRLLVMHEGQLVAELDSDHTTEEEVLAYAIGQAA